MSLSQSWLSVSLYFQSACYAKLKNMHKLESAVSDYLQASKQFAWYRHTVFPQTEPAAI